VRGTDAATEAVLAADENPSNGVTVANAAVPKTGFVNSQKFKVPEAVESEFVEAWNARAELMEQATGFKGFDIHKKGDETYVVQSRWASIPEWEKFNLSASFRRHHLPWVLSFPCNSAKDVRVNCLQ
jgi:heme-degrading monooxygenase HmoA